MENGLQRRSHEQTPPDLYSTFWGETRDLATYRRGWGLPDGLAVLQILRSLATRDIRVVYLRRSSRVALADQVAVVGRALEAESVAARLRAAGYPSRFEVALGGRGCVIRELPGPSRRVWTPDSDTQPGLVVCARSRGVPPSGVTLVAGTTPRGLLAAALWATHPGLADIPTPAAFPQRPLEALVHLRVPPWGAELPAAADLDPELWCGSLRYDPALSEWRPSAFATEVRIVLSGTRPTAIRIDGGRISAGPESMLFRLFELLARRSRDGQDTTMADAMSHLDPTAQTRCRGAINARLGDIRRLGPEGFLETRVDAGTGRAAYRLNARILFVDETGELVDGPREPGAARSL
jgi:hypothetical protein